MPEELSNTQNHDVPEEHPLSKILQKLLAQRPELQEWRDALITEQTETGKDARQKYSNLSTQERLSKFFVSLPHSVTGWMIRTLSPENSLLHIDTSKFLEIEQRPYVVIDPFRIGNLGKQHGTFSLREVKSKDEMTQMITAVRAWLLNAQPILSGRIILGADGRIGRFQEVKKGKQGRESQKNPKLVPSNRAYLTMLRGMYNALDSQQYARNHLTQGAKTVADISPDIAQLVSHCVLKKPTPNGMTELINTIHGLVANITGKLQNKSFFYTQKMMIDYLLKLDGGQYDSTRVYWAAKTLQQGLRDRMGKNAGIAEQTILLEQAKDVELFHWKHCICGAKTGKVDISHVLEDIISDFPGFKERIQNYVPLKNAAVFNPFFSFYHEWQGFMVRNPEDLVKAQQLIARQYILITLQEIKTRYGYRDMIPESDQRVLQGRIAILNQLRERFFPSLSEIVLDFGAEKTILNETLKKEISQLHNFFFLGLPSNSATPPETGIPS